ncbi:hypothetical protein [Bordetella avium]|uniref:hypothetical protein n=1 Tax=Bordetella avium TaxID=521 RepID=UPI000E68D66E|nr:hypothetical protein [Bordetella avium]RIQ55341.1 hypothetical protein D0841_16615 [Bordetella avium]
MNPYAYPDDPCRTASPYEGPGESYPGDAPEIGRDEAITAVQAVLAREIGSAYGESADWWGEVLFDHVANLRANVLLALMDDGACPSIREHLKDLTGNFIWATAQTLATKSAVECA